MQKEFRHTIDWWDNKWKTHQENMKRLNEEREKKGKKKIIVVDDISQEEKRSLVERGYTVETRDEFESNWEAATEDRKFGGNKGHKSIEDIIEYDLQYDTAAGVARRRKKIAQDLIEEDDQELTVETLKEMSNKEWVNYLIEHGIALDVLYDQLKTNLNLTPTEAGAMISELYFGSTGRKK